MTMSSDELKKLLASNCKIEKVYPPVFASDAEANIVTVTVKCPDGKMQSIRAYREEAHALRLAAKYSRTLAVRSPTFDKSTVAIKFLNTMVVFIRDIHII